MEPKHRERRYDEVRRCLAEADAAFARAGAVTDERERGQMIEEAETWLVRAERRLNKLIDRPASAAHPQLLTGEDRSFGGGRSGHSSLVWRRTPKA
ncbi:MAG: hypothetical protein E7812_08450 [Phenylobacterium sp.]|nr:MAG: hypothetical protein E7812_08450 [Phenylobacterium sp.]